jgi:hypothetical protein
MLINKCSENQGEGIQLLAQYLKKSSADRPWLIGMLGYLEPESSIFSKPLFPENSSIVTVNKFTE